MIKYIYYTWENVKNPNKNNKLKTSAPTQNKELKLSGGSYSVSDIQDYFEYILKKHGKKSDNLPISIYENMTVHRITFKIKTEYYLKLLTPETTKLPGSAKSKINKDENGENVSDLEITEVVLVHCNIVN